MGECRGFFNGYLSAYRYTMNRNVTLSPCEGCKLMKCAQLTITGLSIHFVIHYGGNYHFLLIQNVTKRPKEGKSTPSEYSRIIMICVSYLFCN